MTPVAPRQVGSHVWRGDELRKEDWTWHLNDADVTELVAAARTGSSALPRLRPKLDALASELIDGRGFELIRGLPVAELGADQAAAAFLTLGRHLGSLRSQNADGDLLGHVRNVGLDAADPDVRIYLVILFFVKF